MNHYRQYITRAARDPDINKFVIAFRVPVGHGRHIVEDAAHVHPVQAREIAYARIAEILDAHKSEVAA